MPFKTLLFNQGILIQNVRTAGWVGLIYFLGLIFTLPLQLLMIVTNENRIIHYNSQNLLTIMREPQLLLIFILPGLLAIFLFRYLQTKLSADFIHSLPIRREAMFHQTVLFGALLLIIPVLLTGIILLGLHTAFDMSVLFKKSEIGSWMIFSSLGSLFVFFTGVFVAIFTGISVVHGVLIYILLFLPAGLAYLTVVNLEYFLYGFTADYYLNNNIEKLVPLLDAAQGDARPLTGAEAVVYLSFIILFYFISLYVYKKRPIETATQALAFPILQPVLKYGVTFCSMLVGGVYFGQTQHSLNWILFGYIVASIAGYFAAEMVLQKTWRVFMLNKWKGYLSFVLAIIVTGLLLQIDITGYEKKVPELTDVERVYFGEDTFPLTDHYQKQKSVDMIQDEREYYFTVPENMENIQKLHRQIIKEHPISLQTADSRSVVFAYELKSGQRVVRQYEIPYKSYKVLYKPIVESEEFKKNYYFLLRDDNKTINRISILPSGFAGDQAIIVEPEKIKEFTEILKEELREESYSQLYEDSNPWANIEFLYSDKKIMNVSWKKSHVKVEKWLKKNGMIEKARVMPDDLDYAVVIKNESGEAMHSYIETDGKREEIFQNRADGLTIKDKQQLEECLRKAKWIEQGTYVIAFYYKGNAHPDIQAFDKQNVPSFIKQHFE